MKLLAASAARIWHAQHPFNLLPYCLYRYQRVATILYQTVIYVACTCTIKITATFLFVPLLLNHQSAIFLVLKSIKCRVTLFSKIKFQSVWVLRYDWWAFCLFKVSVMRRVVPKLPRTLHYTCNKWHIQCRYMSY